MADARKAAGVPDDAAPDDVQDAVSAKAAKGKQLTKAERKALAEAPYLSPGGDDRAKEREEEYSTYEATEQIFVGTVLAFDVGHPVPKTHVELGLVDESQVKAVK